MHLDIVSTHRSTCVLKSVYIHKYVYIYAGKTYRNKSHTYILYTHSINTHTLTLTHVTHTCR